MKYVGALNFLNQWRVLHKFFGTVSLKILHGKSWNSPIMNKIFGCPNFLKSFEAAPQFFGHRETKTNDRIVIPLLSKIFWNKNTSETQTGSPAMILGDVRQKNLTKLWYPYYLRIFETRTFLKQRRVRQRCFFGDLGQKNSDGKTWHPLLIHKLSPY